MACRALLVWSVLCLEAAGMSHEERVKMFGLQWPGPQTDCVADGCGLGSTPAVRIVEPMAGLDPLCPWHIWVHAEIIGCPHSCIITFWMNGELDEQRDIDASPEISAPVELTKYTFALGMGPENNITVAIGVPPVASATVFVNKVADEEERMRAQLAMTASMHRSEQHVGGFISSEWGDRWTYEPAVWDFVVSRFGVRSVADVGCGEGHSARYFAGLGLDVLGIDGSSAAIAVASKHVPTKLHDFEAKPLVIAEVDMVYSCEFVEHVHERAMHNFLATFRAARKVVLMTFAAPGVDGNDNLTAGHHHVNEQPESYWRHTFATIGYQVDEQLTQTVRWLASFPHFRERALVLTPMAATLAIDFPTPGFVFTTEALRWRQSHIEIAFTLQLHRPPTEPVVEMRLPPHVESWVEVDVDLGPPSHNTPATSHPPRRITEQLWFPVPWEPCNYTLEIRLIEGSNEHVLASSSTHFRVETNE